MKKAIAIFVSVLFVFALASLSFAAEKAATAPVAVEKKEAAPVKAEEKKAMVKVKRISGEVDAIDVKAGTLTVKSKKQDVSLSTDDKTVVKKGKETKTLADVVAGDKVIVKYKEVDGKNVAKSIAVK